MSIDFNFSSTIKGFMEDHEAKRLYSVASEAAILGPCLEIGSYCGKSAYFIGTACSKQGGVLFSVDHHRGSEEQQPGQEYFDPDLFDKDLGRVDTLSHFRDTIERAGLLDTVIPVVGESSLVGNSWKTPISMLFIDGGHSFEAAFNDYRLWARHIMPNGFLVIHDIFMDPEAGGQAPRQVYEKAIASQKFEVLEMTGTLGVLVKIRK